MERRWFDRKFELGLGADAAADLLERLGRTPERLADAVRGLPPEILTRRRDGKWSIQENAGHLFDLESLWDQRLNDYGTGAAELHPADLENRKTHAAGHNDRLISDILADFSTARRDIVERLARMSPAELRIKTHGADLLITNFRMPGMDGPELVRELRAQEFDAPVIMVSGNPEARELGEAAGISQFVEKMDVTAALPKAILLLLEAA